MVTSLRLLALLAAGLLTGCPDWSRPDPRLKRVDVPAPSTTAPPPAPDPAPEVGLQGEVQAFKARAAALGPASEAADWRAAIQTLERLETRGQDALERGTAAEQVEAEAALLELTELRDDLVRRQPRPEVRPGG